MDPNNITAPKGKVIVVKVIYTDPRPGMGGFAVALLYWKDGGGDHEPALGSHWCGDLQNPNDKGMPLSSGHPVWYIHHELLVQATIDAFPISASDYRLAVKFLGLGETADDAEEETETEMVP